VRASPPGPQPPAGGAHDALAGLAALRATRWFTGRPVGDAELDRVLEVGRWTGSARNRQPWRVAVIRDADRRAELSRLGAYALHLASAPVVLLLAIDAEAGGADAEFDAGRLAQSLMLAARALGLGSCPVSFFPEAGAARATAIAGVAPPWRVRTGIALGWPAAPPTRAGRPAIPVGRRPLGEMRHDP
jgi:nitroreductase